jgi:hypothetical protein|tara:strand:- start:32 stop:406 length:375 start_codon:yes stop_codon:yes gene_type:complete
MDRYKVKAVKNYNTDFRYDLELGQLGEKHLGKILDNEKVEVKTDYQASDTGNLFIEYFSRGKESGIITTEATWFAFILSNHKIILISTKKLKQLCRPYLNTKRDVKGGDDNTSQGILLPLKDLL